MFSWRSHISRRFVYPKKSYFSKICLPEEEIWLPREIWLLRVNKVSYLPTTRAMHCLLYRNYAHSNNDFFHNRNAKGDNSLCTSCGGRHGGTRQRNTCYLFPRSTRSRDTWSFVFLTCGLSYLITGTLISMRYTNMW